MDELIKRRDKLNDRKHRIRKKLEDMEKIKNDERVKPSFFRRMQTSYKKEEIYVLEDNDKGGEETKDQDEINKIVTKFYTELWKNRRGSRDFSKRKLDKLIKKDNKQNNGRK